MQKCIVFILIFTFTFVGAKCKSHETLSKTTSSYTQYPTIFDRSNRARQLYLWQVFQDLKIRRNFKVADIGAGGGWLTVRLAAFVGPKGKVYAVDILPRYITYIEEEIKTHKLTNVETILGSTTDPNSSENTLDAVIILNAYHEFQKPITMLNNIRKSMKIGARLGILDRDNDQMRTEAREAYGKTGYILSRVNETLADDFLANGHYLALDIVVREAELAGLTFLFSRELGGDYYIAVFANS
jgi:ubiquinone/menaquinone biosynthesis C-methylase UbiE